MSSLSKVLIVDDDPTICSLLSMSLSPLGYDIETVNDGGQALERIQTNQFNVAILDISLPDHSGIEILRHVREKQIETEVIMLTANASLESTIKALRLGACDYIIKPSRSDVIRSTVIKAVEKHHLKTRLAAIYDLSREIALSMDVGQVAQSILDMARRVLKFETCSLSLVDEEQDALRRLATCPGRQRKGQKATDSPTQGRELEKERQQTLNGEHGIVAAVARSGKPIYVPDVHQDPRFSSVSTTTRSELAVPLQVKERVIGVLSVESTEPNAFTPDDTRLLSTLAAQASVAVENARLYQTVKTNYEYYQAVTDSLHDQVLIVDRDYRITDVNAVFLQQTGRTREEVIGQRCYEVIQQHNQPCGGIEDPCPSREVWETGQPVRFTQVRYDQDGIAHWLDVTASPLRDAKGQVTQVIEAHRDMTTERQLEERLTGVHMLGQELVLSRNEQQVAQVAVDAAIFLLQAQLCGLWLMDPKEKKLTFQAHAGSAQSTDHYASLPDDEQNIIAAVARAGEPVYVPDLMALTKNDEPHVGLGMEPESRTILGVPLKMKGELVGILNAESSRPDAFDEAARRLFSLLADYSALALENARLYEETARRLAETRVLQEVMLSAASTLDFDQVLTRAIQTIHRVQGIEQVSLGLPDESGEHVVIHPSHVGFTAPPEGLRIPLGDGSLPAQVYNTGESQMIDDVSQTANYSKHPLSLCSELAVPVWVKDRVIAVLHAASPRPNALDESDLRLFEAIAAQLAIVINNAHLYAAEREQRRLVEHSQSQLVQSEKLAATGRLAASLAHEINNPLQAIRNSLQLVLNFPLKPQEQKEYLQMANEEVERLTNLSTRILDFARRPQREIKPRDLNAIVQKTLALTGKYLQHRQVTLEQDLAPNLPTVMASRGELEQVFLNLVINALDAMPGGGTLQVSTDLTPQGQVAVTFVDDGKGIPPEHLDHIFEPFFSTKEEGTGLGLSISYNVIKRHKGEIKVQSTVGEGTTFTVLLPVLTG